MTSITFDKLSFVDKLKAGGFTEEQARTHADALDTALRDTVATKQDIDDLKRDIELLRRDLTIRLGGIVVVGIVAMATLEKLL